MKQLLFLFLFPCLALAQYTGNAGQKITLGEQTSADGLVFRGVASIDTVTATSKITRANKQDTSAFLLLDTTTNLLWHYKTASNGWIQAGGSTLDTATMLLPYYRAGRNTIIQAADVPTLNQNTTGSAATLTTGRTIQTNLASTSAATFNGSANITPGVTGTLPVANGGTNRTTMPNGYILHGDGTSVDTSQNLFWKKYTFLGTTERWNGLGIGTNNPDPVSFAYHHLGVKGGINAGDGGVINIITPSVATEGQLYGQIAFIDESASNVAAIMRSERGPNTYSGYYSFFTSPGSSISNTIRRMRVQHDGKIGIGLIDATELLDVDGNARIRAVGSGAYGNILNITSDGTLTTAASSDINFKYNINPISYGLETILKLKPVSYQWINGDEYDLGFIAQDAVNVIPEAVDTFHDSSLLFRYNTIIPILTNAIQEQTALIKALEERILTIENQ